MTSTVRRRLLAGGLLTLANALPFSQAIGFSLQAPTKSSTTESDSLRAMIHLGKYYLEQQPEERSANRLALALFGSNSMRLQSLFEQAGLQQAVGRQHDQDFRDGNVLVVDGWVLTRTEARVFALVAIEVTP